MKSANTEGGAPIKESPIFYANLPWECQHQNELKWFQKGLNVQPLKKRDSLQSNKELFLSHFSKIGSQKADFTSSKFSMKLNVHNEMSTKMQNRLEKIQFF